MQKKYIDSSSSVFVTNSKFNQNYVKGMKEGIDEVHSTRGWGSRFGRKISSYLDKVFQMGYNVAEEIIKTHIEH